MEIIENLHWIEGLYSNMYVWIEDDGLILVDAGQPGDRKRIIRYVEGIGRSLSEIKAIFITHADYDHVGSAAAIQEQSGAIVYSGRESANLMVAGKSPKHMPLIIHLVGGLFFRYRKLSPEFIRVIDDGDTITDQSSWTILSTPGHSPDHHSFWSPVHKILFAGDALNTRGDELKCSPDRISDNPQAARQSAADLLLLNPAVFACGHGPPMHEHEASQLLLLHRKLANP